MYQEAYQRYPMGGPRRKLNVPMVPPAARALPCAEGATRTIRPHGVEGGDAARGRPLEKHVLRVLHGRTTVAKRTNDPPYTRAYLNPNHAKRIIRLSRFRKGAAKGSRLSKENGPRVSRAAATEIIRGSILCPARNTDLAPRLMFRNRDARKEKGVAGNGVPRCSLVGNVDMCVGVARAVGGRESESGHGGGVREGGVFVCASVELGVCGWAGMGWVGAWGSWWVGRWGIVL